MTDRTLIEIPKDGNYIEILGHRIDGFESFEAFCEYLNKCAVLEETVNRQQAEIERLEELAKDRADVNFDKIVGVVDRARADIKAEAIKEFAERLKEALVQENELYKSCAKNMLSEDFQRGYEEKNDSVIKHIDNLVKEMVGAENG